MDSSIPKKDAEMLNHLANSFFQALPDIAAKLAKVDSIPLGIMEIREFFDQAYVIGKESGIGIKKEMIKFN